MSTTMTKLEKSTAKIDTVVSAAQFSEAIEKAYRRERGRFAVQGFRKGRAPRFMIERVYGKDVFYDEAVDLIATEVLESAIKELEIETVGRPTLNVVKAVEGEDLELSYHVSLYPEVTLGQYKGVEIEKFTAPFAIERVQAEVERVQQAHARFSAVNRPIENGDRIIFDYKGRIGEEYFEGGSAEKAQLDIGSGQFIPGFEEGMIGIEVGQDREVPVTFPTEYHAEELAGKAAIFEVHVHEVLQKELPDINDDLAMDASEFDTLDEWKADIERKMREDAKRTEDNVLRNYALEAVVKNATFEVPDAMIESQMDAIMRDFAQRLAYQGINLGDYFQYAGISAEDMREQSREDATRRVQNQIVLDEITKVENITASEEEIAERIKEMAKQYNQPEDKFAATITDADKQYIGEDIAITKTLQFLVDNAVMVDPKPEEAEAEAEAEAAEEEK